MTQEARQSEILAPSVKALIRIEDGLRIPELVRRAYAIATSGRPGPVVLDVPEDIAHGECDYPNDEFYADPETLCIPAQRPPSSSGARSGCPRRSAVPPLQATNYPRRGRYPSVRSL